MIEMARQRVPEGTFHIGSFVDFQLPPCRAVTAFGEVFNYLFDPAHSPATLGRVFQRIHEALEPGGILMFDVCEPGRHFETKQSFREAQNWTCLVEFQHDVRRRQLARRIVTFRRIGDVFRRHEETHRQQLYPRGEVVQALERVGFEVEVLPGYGPYIFSQGMVGFFARKG